MNWKLTIQLSFFGLLMAVATVSLIPSTIEPLFWLATFVASAYFIATNCTEKYFQHGFMVSMFNCVWITAAHVLFFSTYIANHPEEAAMSAGMPMANHPRMMMLIMGPLFGAAFGLILGLFAFGASKVFKKKQ